MMIFLMCCSLRARQCPPELIEELALHAAARCRPPFPPSEAVAIVRDVVQRYRPGGPASRRPPTETRLDIMACIAAAAGPMTPAQVAQVLRLPRDAVKRLMLRMAKEYGELVSGKSGYLLAGTVAEVTDPDAPNEAGRGQLAGALGDRSHPN